MGKWLSLTVGSVAGGVARYLLSARIYGFLGSDFPYGTLVINLSGCFLIGIFDSMAETRLLLGPNERLLLMTGFCGAYTTFSTFILETSKLVSDGEMLRALTNLTLSCLIGFFLFRLGSYAGAKI